jgi:TPR repeat protein
LKKLDELSKANLKKAESGDVVAMVRTGEAYLNGDFEGGKSDSKLAFHWFKKAADKGNAEAMGTLGSLYSRGDGVEKDHEEAFKWSLKAAQKGDLDAQYFIGLCYYDGQGVEEDLTKAVQWLGKAMDRGHSEAKDKLVEMFLRGELQAVAFKSLSERLKKLESQK